MIKDADIRDDLCFYLEEQYGKVRFLEELTIGKSRADIVMVTRKGIYGVEIKSDADTYTRLSGQVLYYDKYFDYNIIIVGSKHAQHAHEHVPSYWGIISVEFYNGKLDFYEIRKPEKSPKSKLQTQIKLMWRRELLNIQLKNSLYKYENKTRSYVEKYVISKVDADKLKDDIIEELYQRDYSEFLEN